MLVQYMLGRRLGAGVDGQGQNGHLGHLLQHGGVVDGLGGILAPGKRPVAGAQHGGHMHRVDAAPGEGLQNHLAGVPLVILVNFFGRQLPRAGHRAVKIIGVGGAPGGEIQP